MEGTLRQLVSSNGQLLFDDIPTPLNPYTQGSYSSEIASLSATTISQIAYPGSEHRPPLKELIEMAERDPVAAKCVSLKALRAIQAFGNYTHPKKDIESFVNSNLQTLSKSFKRTLFRLTSSVILTGVGIAEITFTPKARGFQGQWRLASINVLDPQKIVSFIGQKGRIEAIEYDNGNGKIVKIPYKKCIHIVNNSGLTFDEKELWGIGDGIAALNYYKLKRVVLTQLALATKNNSTGLLHARVPNTGRTVLIDSKMKPLKDSSGKPIEVTKQIALNYQLQDLNKKDYIVTDLDVEINRIQTQNDERFWEYVLNYIDRAIQQAFGVPVGIFDSGVGGIQNVGLSRNFKSVFDSTIYAITTLLKEELINKVVKRLLYFNFPFDWFKNNFGEFIFDAEEDQETINGRLSTISSLIASGIIDMNDTEVIGLIRKNLGLPALTEDQKAEKEEDAMNAKIQKMIQAEMQKLQGQAQIDQLNQPPQPPPEEGQPASAQTQEDYPEA
ncbi:hypothetical protein [Chroococcidiopsis sp.]|uniref:hypothetical protein n=1 Tax=Chroococcidiopsis sp. TaxID=3088168 RepID=UPI003F3440BD